LVAHLVTESRPVGDSRILVAVAAVASNDVSWSGIGLVGIVAATAPALPGVPVGLASMSPLMSSSMPISTWRHRTNAVPRFWNPLAQTFG